MFAPAAPQRGGVSGGWSLAWNRPELPARRRGVVRLRSSVEPSAMAGRFAAILEQFQT
jgi:hypothetical protein